MLRRIINIILYVSFCVLAGGGLMLKFSFVKGLGPQTVLGLAKPQWEAVHLYTSYIMIAAVLVHLIINRAWIHKVGACKNKLALCVFLIAGIGIGSFLALYPTKVENRPGKQAQIANAQVNK